jgi:hypothetical protein
MKKITLFLSLLCASFYVLAQDPTITHTMAYHKIEIIPTKTSFFKRYIAPGKEAICGFYSIYNNTMYLCGGGKFKVPNVDYIHDALQPCCEKIVFDDGPKPYAMMQFDIIIEKIDYETNKIYAKADGADIVIETFNKEIDELYNKYYKADRLGKVRMRIILKNWTYEPESNESYAENTVKYRKRAHWKTKRARNREKYMHESEYMK